LNETTSTAIVLRSWLLDKWGALQFDKDGLLYAADNSTSNIVRVDPDGSLSVFAHIPSENTLGAKGGGPFGGGGFGGGGASRSFLVATFSAPDINPPGAGAVFSAFEDDGNVTVIKLASGLDGIELLNVGPGGVFGTDIFVPTIGGAANADGILYTMSQDRTLTPFMIGLDAVAVAFDTENILGGGMFVSDINDGGGAGKIWRITDIVTIRHAVSIDQLAGLFVAATSSAAPDAELFVTAAECLEQVPMLRIADRYFLVRAVPECGDLDNHTAVVTSSRGGSASIPLH
jgi:hypothetical protein